MIRRTLQLLASAYLLAAILVVAMMWFSSIRISFDFPIQFSFEVRSNWFNSNLLKAIAIFIGLAFITWNNVRFDWLHLKTYRMEYRLPRSPWLIGGCCALIPVLLYCAFNMHATYDSHLSLYDVWIQMPSMFWEPGLEYRAQLTLAYSGVGICLVLFYLFLFSALANMYLSGIFSSSRKTGTTPLSLSWLIIGARIALAAGGLWVAFQLLSRVVMSVGYLIIEGNEFPEMLYFINVGPLVLRTINAVIILAYALWIFIEATRALRVKMSSFRGIAQKG